MKKFFLKSVVIGSLIMTSVSASAQIDLGNLSKVVSSAVGKDVSSIITGKNNVSKENIVGTWTYKQPSISFESNDLLKQAGGQLTSAAIEKKLTQPFTKETKTESGRIVDAFFSKKSVDNRIVNSAELLGTASTLLEYFGKQLANELV